MSWINAKVIGANQRRGEAGQVRGHKDFIMSRTELVAFADNPSKWISGADVKRETKSMTFGSVLDCLATTPDELLSKFAVTPATYPATPKKKGDPIEQKPWNRNANFCDEWETARKSEGFSVVSQPLLNDATKAFDELHKDRDISSLIECSEKQVLIVADWKDDDTGLIIPFSGLIDLVPDKTSPTWGKMLVDIKTARNGNPATWARVVDDSGYDIQAAIYSDIHFAATGEDRTDFVHIIQENTFPFHVVSPPPALSAEFISWGRSKYKRALHLYCQCLKHDFWPGYETVGMVFGKTQIVGPEDCWNYRKCAGMTEFKMPLNKPENEENHDLIP